MQAASPPDLPVEPKPDKKKKVASTRSIQMKTYATALVCPCGTVMNYTNTDAMSGNHLYDCSECDHTEIRERKYPAIDYQPVNPGGNRNQRRSKNKNKNKNKGKSK
jgi:predicted RNA-binding Zn-ribbon protein involved in translation (DUF1610 family)